MFATGELRQVDAVISNDYIDHQEPHSTLQGAELFSMVVKRVRTRFPDLTVQIEDLISQGDRVAVRLTWHATHENGPFVAEGFDIVRGGTLGHQ